MDEIKYNSFSAFGMICSVSMITIVWYQLMEKGKHINHAKAKCMIFIVTLETCNVLASFWQEWTKLPEVAKVTKILIILGYLTWGITLYYQKKDYTGCFFGSLVMVFSVAIFCDYFPKNLPQYVMSFSSALVSSTPLIADRWTADSREFLEGAITMVRVVGTLCESMKYCSLRDFLQPIKELKIKLLLACSVFSMIVGLLFMCVWVWRCLRKPRFTKLPMDLKKCFELLEITKKSMDEFSKEVQRNGDSEKIGEVVKSLYYNLEICHSQIAFDLSQFPAGLGNNDIESSRRGTQHVPEETDKVGLISESIKRRVVEKLGAPIAPISKQDTERRNVGQLGPYKSI